MAGPVGPGWSGWRNLHPIATVHGIPIAWALTGAKADERAVLEAMLDRLPLAGHALI